MALIKKNAYFYSTDVENTVRTAVWENDELEKVAVIQISHAALKNIDDYEAFASFLADNGFVVCGNDHLGHGRTAKGESKTGILPDDGDIRLVDDMHRLSNIMHKEYENLPYFILGEGVLGSLTARKYCALFGEELTGAVFIGTVEVPSFFVLLSDSCGKLFNLLGKNRKIKGFSFSLMRDIFKLSCSDSARDWAFKLPDNFPVLLISGDKDVYGMFGAASEMNNDNITKAGAKPTLKIYNGVSGCPVSKDRNRAVEFDILSWIFSALQND